MFHNIAAATLDLALLRSSAMPWGAAEQGKRSHPGSMIILGFKQKAVLLNAQRGEGGESVPWQPVSLRCLIVSPQLWCRHY